MMGLERKTVTEEEVRSVIIKAEELRKTKRYQEAIDILVDILQFGILKPSIYFHLGNIYYDMGDLSRAEYAYKRTIELAPEHTNAYYNLSAVYKKMDMVEESVKTLRKAYLLELKHPRKAKLTQDEKKWARIISLKQISIITLIILVVYVVLRYISFFGGRG
ncbi:MAG TPA: tetratricopeptide repeat protein [bacterium]|nr:tetratricopeptide repeat protein [bacterium]HOL55100.1 tetratricopeptide repeat protein [bacterium]HOP56159.1 tetratricopeptide repeat protein [bacterium]HPC77650.1 tetratricopeptide repeat protein [bacterium]HPO82074.1 tetratricopeptide repeat protein [bacterium]